MRNWYRCSDAALFEEEVSAHLERAAIKLGGEVAWNSDESVPGKKRADALKEEDHVGQVEPARSGSEEDKEA
jgi:hypothetical protein